MGRIIAISFFLILFGAKDSFSQANYYMYKQKWEFGFMGGGMTYQGDLNPDRSQFEFRPSVGIFSRWNLSDRWALRVSAFGGQVAHSDESNSNLYFKQRNLSFRSNILDAALQMEFNFYTFRVGFNRYSFTPYIFFGAAGTAFSPEAQDADGNWVALQPLGTEGQSAPNIQNTIAGYSLIQPAASTGGGVKYSLNKHWTLNGEVAWRILFTDYLDDVSGEFFDSRLVSPETQFFHDRSGQDDQPPIGERGRLRGDPLDNDSYLIFSVGFSYRFRTFICPPPSNKGF